MGRTWERGGLAGKSGSKGTLILIFLSHSHLIWGPLGHAHNPVLKKQVCPGLAEMPLSKVSRLGREQAAPFSCALGCAPAYGVQPQWQGARQISTSNGLYRLETFASYNRER